MDRTARVEEIADLILTNQWKGRPSVIAYAEANSLQRDDVVELASDAFALLCRQGTSRDEVRWLVYQYQKSLLDRARKAVEAVGELDPITHKLALEATKQLAALMAAQSKGADEITVKLAATPARAAELVKEIFRKPKEIE